MVISKKYNNLNRSQLLELAIDLLFNEIVWTPPSKDISIKTYYLINKIIANRIKSLPEYESALKDLLNFKRSVYKEASA